MNSFWIEGTHIAQARQRPFLCRVGPTKFMSTCEPLYSKEDLDAIIKLLYNKSSIEYNGPIKTGDPVNKRILELMEQATTVTEADDPDFRHESFNRAKFAQLIVKECAELAKIKAFIIMQKAEEYAADKEEIINAASAAFQLEMFEQEIKEHFGVEE